MQSKAATVDAYLAEVEPERRPALRELRAAIRRAAPGASEAMRHGMPSYELAGELFCAFASQRQYVALYFCDFPALDRHRAALGTDDCGKSCIRYRDAGDMPLDAIEAMVRDGAASWQARASAGGPARPGHEPAKKAAAKKASARKK